MIKYSTAELLSLEYPKTGFEARKIAKKNDFDYKPEQGYLYLSLRAISSRCNGNGDSFSPQELEAHWDTYFGCPNFLEHDNTNWRKARGVVADVKFHPDNAPKELLESQEDSFSKNGIYNPTIWTPDEHKQSYAQWNDKSIVDYRKDNWIQLLVEVDALSYPKYAKALTNGKIDKFSMGCDVVYSICSVCGNKAETEYDYCNHINETKNQWIVKQGKQILAFEDNRDINFFEISGVREPADPTADLIALDNEHFTEDEKQMLQVACKSVLSLLHKNSYKSDEVIELSKEVTRKDMDMKKVASLISKIRKDV